MIILISNSEKLWGVARDVLKNFPGSAIASDQAYREIDVAIDCSAGTYIRAIARDLGAALQTGGTLAGLIRTSSSGFSLANSLTFDELIEQLQQE